VIGYARIIKMLEVRDGRLMVESKGIYSIEKFIIARRLMYWQVYLHKTVICAEQLIVRIYQRAKELARAGHQLFASPALQFFLTHEISQNNFTASRQAVKHFLELDDYDVFAAIKVWCGHDDAVLARLSRALVNRRLFHVELRPEPVDPAQIGHLRQQVRQSYGISEAEARYFVFTDSTSNSAYNPEESRINLIYRDGTVKDVTIASDQLNLSVLSRPVVKWFLCYPKELTGRG